MAVKQALSDMIVNSGLGKISVIDFELGPPHGGQLSFRFVVDGCCMPLCEPNDAYPFLESLRDWMERSLVCDKEGTLHPEILTIDCTEAVYSVILFQAGWDEFSEEAEAVSGLIIIRSGQNRPIFRGFCRTRQTITRLYCSVVKGIRRYGTLFNTPGSWYDTGRFSILDRRTTTDRLLARIHSEKLEKYARNSKNCAH